MIIYTVCVHCVCVCVCVFTVCVCVCVCVNKFSVLYCKYITNDTGKCSHNLTPRQNKTNQSPSQTVLTNRPITFIFTFPLKTFNRHFCPIWFTISTFVTREKHNITWTEWEEKQLSSRLSSEDHNCCLSTSVLFVGRQWCSAGPGEVWTGESWVSCCRHRDSAVLTLVWTRFLLWGSRTEKSGDFSEQLCLLSAMAVPAGCWCRRVQCSLGRVVWPGFGGRRCSSVDGLEVQNHGHVLEKGGGILVQGTAGGWLDVTNVRASSEERGLKQVRPSEVRAGGGASDGRLSKCVCERLHSETMIRLQLSVFSLCSCSHDLFW